MCSSTLLKGVRAEISRRTVNVGKAALLALVILVSAPALANAEPPTSEWRLLGPAFSVHDSLAGAPWAGPRVPEFCDIGGGAGGRQCTTSERAVSIAPGLPRSNCAATPGGGARCSFYTRGSYQAWHGQNPALGLEYTRRYTDHADRYFVDLVRDSYGTPSAMVGAARMWPLTNGRIRVEAGVAGMLWYRTLDESMDRGLVPVVLPVLSISDRESGLGANFALAPMIRFRGRQYSVVTLTLQTTYRFK